MKILFVAFTFSIHSARWISQLKETGWDIHFFSSMPFHQLHKDISGITFHENFYNNIYPDVKGVFYSSPALHIFSFIQNRIIKKFIRKMAGIMHIEKPAPEKLAGVIKKIKPDIIHSMETQHGGYLTAEARKKIKNGFPLWIHSNWGIDLHFFGQLQEHVLPIIQTLSGVDILLVEGRRDAELAAKFGFKNKVYTFPSVGGGFRIPSAPLLPVIDRKTILIKGTQDTVRRGLVAIRAVEQCVDLLAAYEIILYSANEATKEEAKLFYQRTGKEIKVIDAVSQDEMLEMNGRARINLCVNASDGLPNAMIEAMLMGAFPIQSDTSLADEWIIDKKNGMIVPAEDVESIGQALRNALTNDELIAGAAPYNRALVADKLEYNKVRAEVIEMYKTALINQDRV